MTRRGHTGIPLATFTLVFFILLLPARSNHTGYIPHKMMVLCNQWGYGRRAAKRVVVQLGEPREETRGKFEVRDVKTDTVVYTGDLTEADTIRGGDGREWKARYRVGIFSELHRSGRYYVRAVVGDQSQESHVFRIASGALATPLELATKWFYFQRCGQVDHSPYWEGGCHLDDGFVDKNGNEKRDEGEPMMDATGGWHDAAGDASKYVKPSQTPGAVFALAKAAGLVGENHVKLRRRLIRESRWGARFLLKMQRPDGAFYAKVTDSEGTNQGWIPFTDHTDGERGNADDRRVVQKAASAEGGLAACAALARVADREQRRNTNLAAGCRKAAREAWKYYRPKVSPEHCSLGQARQGLSASLEMQSLTDQEKYLKSARSYASRILNLSSANGSFAKKPGGPVFTRWTGQSDHVAHLARFVLLNPEDRLAPRAEKCLRRWANYVTEKLASNPFQYARGNYYGNKCFFYPMSGWYCGSNPRIMSTGWALAAAAQALEDADLREVARSQINWVLGLNPLGVALLEGAGDFETDDFAKYYATYSPKDIPGYIPNGLGRPPKEKGKEGKHSDIPYYDWPESKDHRPYKFIESWLPQNVYFVLAGARLLQH